MQERVAVLWAGLIKALHDACADHFGPTYSQAELRANRLLRRLKLLILVATCMISALVLFTGVDTAESFPEDSSGSIAGDEGALLDAQRVEYVKNIGKAVVGVGATVGAGIATLKSFMDTKLTRAEQIVKDASSPTFRHKLGYMDRIKSELTKLGAMLQDPTVPLPTMWEYLLPQFTPGRDLLLKWMTFAPRRPCRLVLGWQKHGRAPYIYLT